MDKQKSYRNLNKELKYIDSNNTMSKRLIKISMNEAFF